MSYKITASHLLGKGIATSSQIARVYGTLSQNIHNKGQVKDFASFPHAVFISEIKN